MRARLLPVRPRGIDGEAHRLPSRLPVEFHDLAGCIEREHDVAVGLHLEPQYAAARPHARTVHELGPRCGQPAAVEVAVRVVDVPAVLLDLVDIPAARARPADLSVRREERDAP